MRWLTLGTALVAAAVLGARAACAQRVRPPRPPEAHVTPPVCRVDSTAAWFRAQRSRLDESRDGWSDDALRDALVRGTSLDVVTPLPVQLGFELADGPPAGRADSATLARLRALAAQRGAQWPTLSVVGPAGVRAVWLAAAGDTALAPAVLRRFLEAGAASSLPADVAVLDDRVRVHEGRKQLYGTQMRVTGTRVAPFPIEDPDAVDARRDSAELPPLAVSLCLARRALVTREVPR